MNNDDKYRCGLCGVQTLGATDLVTFIKQAAVILSGKSAVWSALLTDWLLLCGEEGNWSDWVVIVAITVLRND